jgi:dTMP kinase
MSLQEKRVSAKFITVEGGEGVGKTTNMGLIQSILESRGFEVCITREPGGTALGEMLRASLLNPELEPPVAMAELLMIFAARAQHISTVIEPALAAGQWVLCDRFTDATYAYQGFGRGIDLPAIATLEQLVQGERRPDVTVLLDLDPLVGLERAQKRAELDRFELEEAAFFNRVREGYLSRAEAEPARWIVVDAAQSLEEVSGTLNAQLTRWLDHG